MREFRVNDEVLTAMFTMVTPHLDECQGWFLACSTSRLLGRSGIVAEAEATEVSRSTLQKAVGVVDSGVEVSARIGPSAIGRSRAVDAQPDLLVAPDDFAKP